jgi:DNA-binding transcriptional regulator YiaG
MHNLVSTCILHYRQKKITDNAGRIGAVLEMLEMTKKQITSAAIKRVRDRLAETQEQFATRLGIDQATVSRWEAGKPPTHGPAFLWLQRVLADIERVHPA